MTNPQSPWHVLDWNTLLTEETVRNDAPAAPTINVAAKLMWLWRQGPRGRRRVRIVVVSAIVLGAVVWNLVNESKPVRNSQSPQIMAMLASAQSPPPDDRTAAGEYSRMSMVFYSYGSWIQGQFRDEPFWHPVTQFRYGVDSNVPGKVPTDTSPTQSFPTYIELPASTRFVTVQVRLDDGTLSPIRRFDVPQDVRKQQ